MVVWAGCDVSVHNKQSKEDLNQCKRIVKMDKYRFTSWCDFVCKFKPHLAVYLK